MNFIKNLINRKKAKMLTYFGGGMIIFVPEKDKDNFETNPKFKEFSSRVKLIEDETNKPI